MQINTSSDKKKCMYCQSDINPSDMYFEDLSKNVPGLRIIICEKCYLKNKKDETL